MISEVAGSIVKRLAHETTSAGITPTPVVNYF
jgi:hypothetical protein